MTSLHQSSELVQCFVALHPEKRHLSPRKIHELVSIESAADRQRYTFQFLLNNISLVLPSTNAFDGDPYDHILLSHEGTKSGAPVVCAQVAQALPGRLLIITFGENQSVFQPAFAQ